MSESSLPRAARLLGLAGLIPSIAMVAAMLAWPEAAEAAATAGRAYGAVIASFVGGAWWGLAARAERVETRVLALAVLPSLTAWPALLVPPVTGLVVLGLVFAALLPTDRRLVAEGVAPDWWMALRVPLSLGMAALHLVAAVVLAVHTPGVAAFP